MLFWRKRNVVGGCVDACFGERKLKVKLHSCFQTQQKLVNYIIKY